VAVLQIVAISGILSADASVRVLAGAWITPVGVALAGYGFWLSGK
jgi:dihydroorotate dehydrogenase